MANSRAFLSSFWNRVKTQVVQPVPQQIQFCQFQWPHRACVLEAGGACNLRALDIRPHQTLVVLRAAAASTGGAWPSEMPAHGAARAA